MDRADILAKRDELISKYGAWTAHNIKLADGIYTITDGIAGNNEFKLRRTVQVVHDLSRVPIESLRILDLGSLEGLYAIEFAQQGATAVAIEGRTENIEKARFAKDALGLQTLELVQDDVRNINVERYGGFDVVLCLGILYHLASEDVYPFLERIYEMTDDFAIIDTHISPTAQERNTCTEHEYWGFTYQEPYGEPLWAALDNPRSFVFTRPSLYNALGHIGFSSVTECHYPTLRERDPTRVTMIAMKRRKVRLLTAPFMDDVPVEDVPEDALPALPPAYAGHPPYPLYRRLPASFRRVLSRLVRAKDPS